MTKYKRWIKIESIAEKELRNLAVTIGFRIKSLKIPEGSQWYHLYLEGSKKSMQDFDNLLQKKKIEVRNRKPKGAKDIGAYNRETGTQFEYQVRNVLREYGYNAEKRAASGSAGRQKGDVILYDDYGNVIMTLETTKTRGKGIWISIERLKRLLREESEAIIFRLGDSTIKFTIIPFESNSHPDMTFIDYLNYHVESYLEPGQIDLKDDRDTAISLFDLMNLIVERMITIPKKVDEIYAKLPDSKKEAIKEKDSQISSEE